jgi:hypothetical protein
MSATQPTPTATVAVTPAWSSKINWTQAVAVLSSLLVLLFGPDRGLSPEQQAAIVTVITLVQGGLTVLLKVFFTSTVHPSSLPKKA